MGKSKVNRKAALLDESEQRQQLRKLRLENRWLALRLSPSYRRAEFWKLMAGLAGVITAATAVVAILVSFFQWRASDVEQRSLHVDQRLDAALTRLAGKSASERMAGVASLKSFLSGNDLGRQSDALMALCHSLAKEDDAIVRLSIVEAIKSAPLSTANRSVLNEALIAMVAMSRAVVDESQLWKIAGEAKDPHVAVDISSAIVVLLRKGATEKDLSGIYAAQADFSKLNLSGWNFQHALLEGASFDDGILDGASFNGAALDGTSFQRADLRGADLGWSSNFDIHDNASPLRKLRPYMRSEAKGQLPLLYEHFIAGTNFSCADLRGATFTGRDMFRFSSLTGPYKPSNLRPARFEKANLEHADLQSTFTVVLLETRDKSPFYNLKLHLFMPLQPTKDGPKQLGVEAGEFFEQSKLTEANVASVSINAKELSRSFRASNWRDAKLPQPIIDLLTKFPPEDEAKDVKCCPSLHSD